MGWQDAPVVDDAQPAWASAPVVDAPAQPAPAPQKTGPVADVLNALGSGIEQGVTGALDLPRTMEGLAEAGVGKVGKYLGASPETIQGIQSGIRTAGEYMPGVGGLLQQGPTFTEMANKAIGSDYTPQTTAGKYAQSIGQFVPATIATGGASVPGLMAGAVLPGAASEAAAQAVQGTRFQDYGGLARVLGSFAPAGLAALGRGAVALAAPLTRTGQEATAANMLAGAATNPAAAIANAKNVAQSGPAAATLGEATGDVGLAQLQKHLETVSPDIAAATKGVQAQQNIDRLRVLRGLAPEGAQPMAPSQYFQNAQQQIESAAQAKIADLTQKAEAANAALPQPDAPEVLGAKLRSAIEGVKNEQKANVNALYDAIDPQGAVTVPTAPVVSTAKDITTGIGPLAAPMSGEEGAIFNAASKMSPVMKFNDLADLDKRINAEVSAQRMAAGHDTPTVARLLQLKSSVQDTMNNALDHAENFTPPPGYTGPMPNVSPEAAAARAEANKAFAQYAQTYRQGPVSKAIGTSGYAGQYKVPDAALVSSAVRPGDLGYESAKSFLNAAQGDPVATAAMKDMAISKLQGAIKPNGVLDAQTLAKWKSDYGNALRAIDEASPGFSSSFDNVAAANEAVNAAKTETAQALTWAKEKPVADLLKVNHPEEMQAFAGRLMNAPDAPTKIDAILQSSGNDPAVLNGLRAAVSDWLTGAASNAGVMEGEQLLSGPKLMKFIRENPDSLQKLYGPEGYAELQSLAADLQRSQAYATSIKTAQSDTARNVIRAIKDAAPEVADKGIGGLLFLSAIQSLSSGSFGQIALSFAGLAGKSLVSKLRAQGMKNVNDLLRRAIENPEFGAALMAKAVGPDGKPIPAYFTNLSRALDATMSAAPGVALGATTRTARASGGRISADDAADALIRAADQARKMHNSSTEALLGHDDNTIAHALNIASRSI